MSLKVSLKEFGLVYSATFALMELIKLTFVLTSSRPRRLLNALCTFKLRPVSTGQNGVCFFISLYFLRKPKNKLYVKGLPPVMLKEYFVFQKIKVITKLGDLVLDLGKVVCLEVNLKVSQLKHILVLQ